MASCREKRTQIFRERRLDFKINDVHLKERLGCADRVQFIPPTAHQV